jgi:hypothetical protein
MKVVTKRNDGNKQVAKITVELEGRMYPPEDIKWLVLDIVNHLKDLDVECVESEGKSKIIITFNK